MRTDIPPLVSVVMPAYNCERTLSLAIDSVLNQTYSNFELIIINDGSTDNTVNIIKSYSDYRIILINNQENQTIVPSLNAGLKKSKGKYIIRMDSDDICVKTRFEKQVSFMEKNIDIGICGSCATKINKQGTKIGNMIYDKEDHIIKFKMLHQCHLLHPSIIIRKEVLSKNKIVYDTKHIKSEDYDLFVRLIDYTNFSNIQEPLLFYRETETSINREKTSSLDSFYNEIKLRLFQKIGIKISINQLRLYTSICYQKPISDPNLFIESVKLIEDIFIANKKSKYFKEPQFNKYLQLQFTSLFRNYTLIAPFVIKKFFKSTISYSLIEKNKILMILVIKLIFSSLKIKL